MTLSDVIEVETAKNYSFLDEKFQSPPKEIEYIGLISELIPIKTVKNYLIDVDDIIGTYHSSYQNIDFRKVCKHLNKNNEFKKYDVDDENFLKELYDKKDPNKDYAWSLVIYNGKGYIENGNHRTVSAKLLAKCGKIPSKIYVPVVFIVDLSSYRGNNICEEMRASWLKDFERAISNG